MVFTPPVLGAEKEKRAGAKGGGRKCSTSRFSGRLCGVDEARLGIWEIKGALAGGGHPLPRLPQAWKQPLSRAERPREPTPGRLCLGPNPRGEVWVSAFKGGETVRRSFTRRKGKGKDVGHFSIFPEPPRFTETAPEPQKMPR